MLKLVARLSVSVLPDPIADDPVPLIVHWLFDRLPGPPGVMGPVIELPASLYRYSEFVFSTYSARHPFAALRLPLISA